MPTRRITVTSRRLRRCEREMNGGAEGGRTPDLRVANAALSQLSYGPTLSGGAILAPEIGASTPFTNLLFSLRERSVPIGAP